MNMSLIQYLNVLASKGEEYKEGDYQKYLEKEKTSKTGIKEASENLSVSALNNVTNIGV